MMAESGLQGNFFSPETVYRRDTQNADAQYAL